MSSKQKDFEFFADICERVLQGRHLSSKGLVEIAAKATQMNSSGRRKYRSFLPARTKV
jgi:hypothetical protein